MKKRHVWVVGHKNPDTDSICAAITYANLKNKLEEKKKLDEKTKTQAELAARTGTWFEKHSATTEDVKNISFSSRDIKKLFGEVLKNTSLCKQNSTHEILEKKVDEKFYLSETIKPISNSLKREDNLSLSNLWSKITALARISHIAKRERSAFNLE